MSRRRAGLRVARRSSPGAQPEERTRTISADEHRLRTGNEPVGPQGTVANLAGGPVGAEAASLLALQRTIGNQVTRGLLSTWRPGAGEAPGGRRVARTALAEERDTGPAATTDPASDAQAPENQSWFKDLGMAERLPIWWDGGLSTGGPAAASATAQTAGGTTGSVPAPPAPSFAFRDLGRVGRDKIHWDGGNGGTNHWVDWAWVPPQYDSEDPKTPTGKGRAWVKPGTGTVKLSRKYYGANLGDNGQYYFSFLVQQRADVHEQRHTNFSRKHYRTFLAPALRRASRYRGRRSALRSGATGVAAAAKLDTVIDWLNAQNSFVNADAADNNPGGAHDVAEQNTSDWMADFGPGTVSKKAYNHIMDVKTAKKPLGMAGKGAANAKWFGRVFVPARWL